MQKGESMTTAVPVMLEPIKQFLCVNMGKIVVLYRCTCKDRSEDYCIGFIDVENMTKDQYEAEDWCMDAIQNVHEIFADQEIVGHG